MDKYNIKEEDLVGSKENANAAINLGVHLLLYRRVIRASEDRSKLKFFLEGKGPWFAEQPAQYMKIKKTGQYYIQGQNKDDKN